MVLAIKNNFYKFDFKLAYTAACLRFKLQLYSATTIDTLSKLQFHFLNFLYFQFLFPSIPLTRVFLISARGYTGDAERIAHKKITYRPDRRAVSLYLHCPDSLSRSIETHLATSLCPCSSFVNLVVSAFWQN